MKDHTGYEYKLRPGTDDWLHHEGLARLIAQRFAKQWDLSHGDTEELGQDLLFKIWEVQERNKYDPSLGYKASTFICRCLINECRGVFVLRHYVGDHARRGAAQVLKGGNVSLDQPIWGVGKSAHEIIPDEPVEVRENAGEFVAEILRLVDDKTEAQVRTRFVRDTKSKSAMSSSRGETEAMTKNYHNIGRVIDRLRDAADIVRAEKPDLFEKAWEVVYG